MSEPQILEEAWSKFVGELNKVTFTGKHPRDAVRALALAVLEEAANEEGNPFPLEGEGYAELQRRIEALGK